MADISGLGFDAQQVEPNGFDLLPAGEYDAVIVDSKVVPTKAGDGKILKLQLQVLNGQYQNRTLFDQLNLWNPSQKAEQIAKGTLSALCRAVNVLTPKDTSELHNKPVRISVGVQKSEEYGDQNKIKAYKPRQSGPSAIAPTPNAAMQETIAQQPW